MMTDKKVIEKIIKEKNKLLERIQRNDASLKQNLKQIENLIGRVDAISKKGGWVMKSELIKNNRFRIEREMMEWIKKISQNY